MELEPALVEAFAAAFIPRFDQYPVQLPSGRYLQKKEPLPLSLVKAHLLGNITLGAYALDQDSLAGWVCLDADTEAQFAGLCRMATNLADAGEPAYLEVSRRGGHLWLFLPKTPGVDARRLGKQLVAEHEIDEPVEIYPKQDYLLEGAGSLVRLPFGVHQKTGKRYHFITPSGEPIAPTIREQLVLLAQPARLSPAFIGQMLERAAPAPMVSPTPTFTDLSPGSGETLSEALKATISVAEFVGQFVVLDNQGRGHCPFHRDEHQSFQVNNQGNYWNCYAGCGGGSIIDFWMRWREQRGEDGSFPATVKDLREMLLT